MCSLHSRIHRFFTSQLLPFLASFTILNMMKFRFDFLRVLFFLRILFCLVCLLFDLSVHIIFLLILDRLDCISLILLNDSFCNLLILLTVDVYIVIRNVVDDIEVIFLRFRYKFLLNLLSWLICDTLILLSLCDHLSQNFSSAFALDLATWQQVKILVVMIVHDHTLFTSFFVLMIHQVGIIYVLRFG